MDAEANKRLADFIRKCADSGQAVTPYIDTTSIERAIQQARRLNEEME